MRRHNSSREAGHGQVEAAQKEMDRARLAQVAAVEILEHPIGLDESSPEGMGDTGVVGAVAAVPWKRDRVRDLVWHFVDRDLNAVIIHDAAHLTVELAHRLWGERERPSFAAAQARARAAR